MEDPRDAALLALSQAHATVRELQVLEAALGPIATWWKRRQGRLSSVRGISARRLETLASVELDDRAKRCVEDLQRIDARAVFLPAEEWAAIPDPPVVWYTMGCVPDPGDPCVAMVGARRATAYGLRVGNQLSRGLAEAGVWVVSGLARGIDGACHRGAVAGGGTTLAVLGCGLDVVYPPEHGDLRENILASGGGLLTEYPPGVPALAYHFPRRNRLLVGPCPVLVVIEARLKSGTLTSVRWALEHGREVLALPGPIDSALSEGPLQLLREGATPVGGLADILEALGLSSGGATGEPKSRASLSRAEERLLAWLGAEALDLDALVRVSGEPPGNLLALLLNLELRGHLRRDETGLGWSRSENPPS
jgi:DNA processing protein